MDEGEGAPAAKWREGLAIWPLPIRPVLPRGARRRDLAGGTSHRAVHRSSIAPRPHGDRYKRE